jgi:hypothetical protein
MQICWVGCVLAICRRSLAGAVGAAVLMCGVVCWQHGSDNVEKRTFFSNIQISKCPKWINGYLVKASVYFEISKSPNLQNGEMEIWRNGEMEKLVDCSKYVYFQIII